MRAFVFTDKALAGQAGRFVWLEIDTEKRENAPFRQQYVVPVLPSFFIVDPTSEKVLLRWVGGATVTQLQKMLDEGRAAMNGQVAAKSGASASHTGSKQAKAPSENTAPATPGGADALLARADGLFGEGKNAEAATAFRDALAQAPADWPPRGRATESLLFALLDTDANEACATLARDTFPALRNTPSAANVAALGLEAALGLPEENQARAGLVAALETDALAVVGDEKLDVAADDRSGVYLILVDARKEAKDEAGVKAMAQRWATFLEKAANAAASPAGRTVFDPHRLTAYITLGEPARALPMLEASERDFPDDYNPPARLAVAYKELKRWDAAIAASQRALERAYGPRKLRIYQNLADIQGGRGDSSAARATLEEALQLAESLPPGQRNENTIAGLKKKIDALPVQ